MIKGEKEVPNLASSMGYALANAASIVPHRTNTFAILPSRVFSFLLHLGFYYSLDQTLHPTVVERRMIPHCSFNLPRESKYGIGIVITSLCTRPRVIMANKIDQLYMVSWFYQKNLD